jgi:hypothetical protein
MIEQEDVLGKAVLKEAGELAPEGRATCSLPSKTEEQVDS